MQKISVDDTSVFFIIFFLFYNLFEGNTSEKSLFENHKHVIRLMEKFLFLAAPVRKETTNRASGGDEQVHVIIVSP